MKKQIPYSTEAEQGVLGCAIIDPRGALIELVSNWGSDGRVFYDIRNQTVYRALAEMSDDGVPVDQLTLTEHLRKTKKIEDSGGLTYVLGLVDATPSAANLEYYSKTVKDLFTLRELIDRCHGIEKSVYEDAVDPSLVLDRAEEEIMGVRHSLKDGSKTSSIRDLVSEATQEIEKWHQSKGEIMGFSTGLHDLDRATSGLHRGELTVLGGFPSSGKTALAMNIAENVAVNQNGNVLIFSLEMSGKSLVTRTLCSMSRTNIRNLKDGGMTQGDFGKITRSSIQIAKSKLVIDDTSGLSIQGLRARARREAAKGQLDLILIDYLQLLSADGMKKTEGRQDEVAAISRGLKGMSRELNVPVIALSQLNDDGKMRESRAIGADADGIWVIESVKDEKGQVQESEHARPMSMTIRKQRNGPAPLIIRFMFQKQYTRFESAITEGYGGKFKNI